MQKLLRINWTDLNELSCTTSPSLGLIDPMEALFSSLSPIERVRRLAADNAVVVFSISSCCMCHVVKRLFSSMGVSPTIIELDEQIGGADMEKALIKMVGERPAVPVVFVGGKLVGGLGTLMAAHINGSLVPMLKEAGALWL